MIPQEFGLRYWNMTLARADVWTSITMSVSLATIVTLISACICLPAAYAFARLDFPGRNLLFFSFLAGHAFPKFGLLVAIAGIFLNLGLIGTFWGVVLIQLVGTLLFMIWIPVAAFQAVDRRMEEAARDVGASPLRVFWSITLPQAGPTIAAALLLSFVWHLLRDRGRLADRRAADPHHAGPDDLLHQQPAGDPVRRRPLRPALDPVVRRADVRPPRHRLGQLRQRLRRMTPARLPSSASNLESSAGGAGAASAPAGAGEHARASSRRLARTCAHRMPPTGGVPGRCAGAP